MEDFPIGFPVGIQLEKGLENNCPTVKHQKTARLALMVNFDGGAN